MSPQRIQLSRAKGWRKPENTVVVARPTRFGNPWTIAGAREAGYSIDQRSLAIWCVELFREWLGNDPSSITRMLKDSGHLRTRIVDALPELRGKNLACWCPLDQPCHADVLLELANAKVSEGEELVPRRATPPLGLDANMDQAGEPTA